MKNLLWVLGGGFTAFFGDVNALDTTAKKAPLLLAYFAAWSVAAFAVVMFWGIVIGLGQLVVNIKGRGYGYSTAEALIDYFFYGYRHYRARADASRENQSTRFYTSFLKQLTFTVTAAGSVNAANRVETVQNILGSMAAVVKSYHRDDDDRKGIRANVMLKRDCDAQLRERMLFVSATDRAQAVHCLELSRMTSLRIQTGIVLPLSNDLNKVLPGAPTAFLHPDRFAVIDNTRQIPFGQGVPEQIQTEINTYFNQRGFRSFGSIQMIGRGATIGVVNIEATIAQVFGQTEDERRQLIQNLLPFCSALAIVY